VRLWVPVAGPTSPRRYGTVLNRSNMSRSSSPTRRRRSPMRSCRGCRSCVPPSVCSRVQVIVGSRDRASADTSVGHLRDHVLRRRHRVGADPAGVEHDSWRDRGTSPQSPRAWPRTTRRRRGSNWRGKLTAPPDVVGCVLRSRTSSNSSRHADVVDRETRCTHSPRAYSSPRRCSARRWPLCCRPTIDIGQFESAP
jgi:hypothetical protein